MASNLEELPGHVTLSWNPPWSGLSQQNHIIHKKQRCDPENQTLSSPSLHLESCLWKSQTGSCARAVWSPYSWSPFLKMGTTILAMNEVEWSIQILCPQPLCMWTFFSWCQLKASRHLYQAAYDPSLKERRSFRWNLLTGKRKLKHNLWRYHKSSSLKPWKGILDVENFWMQHQILDFPRRRIQQRTDN